MARLLARGRAVGQAEVVLRSATSYSRRRQLDRR